LFPKAQARLNAQRILALIEEDWLAHNRNRVFIASLVKISLVELGGLSWVRPMRSSLSLRCAVHRETEGYPCARAMVGRLGNDITRMSQRPVQWGWEG
jgi:hypothetical protein